MTPSHRATRSAAVHELDMQRSVRYISSNYLYFKVYSQDQRLAVEIQHAYGTNGAELDRIIQLRWVWKDLRC
jgi:hypothetical protein